MRSRENIQSLCARIMEQVKKTDAGGGGFSDSEVLVSENDEALTRFASNEIHQNLQRKTGSITLRVIRDGSVGRASVNQADDESVKSLVDNAAEACSVARPDSGLPELPDPIKVEAVDGGYDEKTAKFDADMRARKVDRAVRPVSAAGLSAGGKFTHDCSQIAIANSKGHFVHHLRTKATLSLTVSDGVVSGWSQESSHTVEDVFVDRCTQSAIHDCEAAKDTDTIEPGRYTVVLPPEAAGEFLFFLAFYAFNGQAVFEGRSALTEKIGEKVFSESITIRDDCRHPLMLGMPFDFEGTPRQSLPLIEKGRVSGFVYDRRSGKMAGKESTGHSLPQPNSYGPVPMHLVVDSGDTSMDDMVSSTEKGLYIRHFHYTNGINPFKLLITGMTRDGVWRIENGKITRPVKNLRFTESIFNAYGNVTAVADEQKLVNAGFGGDFVSPGMKIRDFHFTSTTEF